MTLKDIWAIEPRITTNIVRREGNKDNNCYLSMGNETPELAYQNPVKDGFVTVEDIVANDWYIWEQPKQNPE